MLCRLAVIALVAALAVPAAGQAGDLAAGRKKAAKCKVCHGLDGVAKIPQAPNIGGESKLYLKKQLKAFRSGDRQDLQMSTVAKGLTDEDIDDLATYYSAIEVEHRVPEMPK